MAQTAPSIDRFVFAGGRVLECENSHGVEGAHEFTPAGLDLKSLELLTRARGLLAPLCESPIEIALGAELFRVLSAFPELFVTAICRNEEALSRAADEVLIVPQFHYGRYRTDLAVRFPWLPRRWLFVECDGKAFHSGDTQIARDRGRHQEMVDAGYRMFRFTGKEINGNPLACVDKVLRYAMAQRGST